MKRAILFLGVALTPLSFVNLAYGDQIFTTPAGAINPLTGEVVSGKADFSVSGTTLTLTLANTLPGIHDAGQLLTDIFFTTSEGSPTLTSETGELVTLGAGGTILTDSPDSSLGWGFGGATLNNVNGFELCVICQGAISASATPSEGILGPLSADGQCDHANASLLTAKHNPLVKDFATFQFTVDPGVTIDNVIFSFGTTPGGNATVPEPALTELIGAGLFGVLLLCRKKALTPRA